MKRALLNLARRLSALGNHDFCPWANRYVYWLKQPIGWFVVGAAAALLTAVFLAPHAWVIFGSLLVVILMGVIWPWVAVRGITAEIAFDCRRCREGDLIHVRLSVHNRWPVPLWGLAVERGFFIELEESGERPVAALACVPGWSKSEFVFSFRPDQRGVYPHEEPEVVTGFPFGIWRARRRVAVTRELLVWPRTTPLTSIPSLRGDIADVIGMLFDRPGNEGDAIGVRPFRQGDRLRSIHWAQTARRDSFIVTERQSAARRLVVIAVDHMAFACAADSSDILETAIRVAASVAQEFHSHHAQVRFVMGSIDLLLEPGTVGLHRLLDALARFQPNEEVATRRKKDLHDALVLVVTSPQQQAEWCVESGARGQLRFVLIEQAPSSASQLGGFPSGDRRRTWIRLDAGSDQERQLRHQWERVCHDSIAS